MFEGLRIELFDRKFFMSLFFGGVGSIRLMKYILGELFIERFFKVIFGCIVVG